jgi:hypothetical protein
MAATTSYGTDDAPDHHTSQTNGFTAVANGHNKTNDEESPLLPQSDSPRVKKSALAGVGTIIAVLLLGLSNSVLFVCRYTTNFSENTGEFVSNADATLVMAAAGYISSEFDRLRDASWLATGYMLGLCAVQPMVCVSIRVARIDADWM